MIHEFATSQVKKHILVGQLRKESLTEAFVSTELVAGLLARFCCLRRAQPCRVHRKRFSGLSICKQARMPVPPIKT